MDGVQQKPTSSSEKLKWQANAAMDKGHYTLAIELFSYALKQVPKYAPYLTNRALCYYHLNDPEKVLKDASASIQANPQLVDGYFYRGKALEMLNRKQEAIDCYRNCCQLQPNQKKYEDALRECLRTSPSSSKANRTVDQIASHNVVCDVCRCYPIVGIRYKCSMCDYYNLCPNCLNSNPNQKEHKDTHPLTQIKQTQQFSQVLSNLLRSEARALRETADKQQQMDNEGQVQTNVLGGKRANLPPGRLRGGGGGCCYSDRDSFNKCYRCLGTW
ncbi:unnamed protein product [Rotaria sordida]|uniref:ZZ-type domain-containing protein n=1 Tax=Rotaria sordida TaxID=392033 RepID=A0A815JXE4_9BILA|nr:unnamed protein product [Rotaria sordida]CAF1384936.1 unnamed protein product [Rotaria sordida]